VLKPDTLGRVAAMNIAFFPSYLHYDLGGIPGPSLKMAATLRNHRGKTEVLRLTSDGCTTLEGEQVIFEWIMPPAGVLKALNFNTCIICCVLYAIYSPVNK
jgi:hypothetical protein